MKKKIIYIYTFDNGDLQNLISNKAMLNHLTQELVDEGRSVEYVEDNRNSKVSFADGSEIISLSLPIKVEPTNATHIYVSEYIFNLNNGQELIDYIFKPSLINKFSKNDYDVGNVTDRLLSFEIDNDSLLLKKVL